MKSRRRLALIMLAVLTMMDAGFAETMFDGTVVAGETATVISSIGGTVTTIPPPLNIFKMPCAY